MEDQDAAIALMQRYNFALLVTQGTDRPVATHLPFHVTESNGHIRLSAHMAKANPQCKDLDGQEVLVVFSGPHAYISPANYEKEQSVPTWNYVAVHAYGKLKVITDAQDGMQVLEDMILQSEPGYKAQWERLPEKYKRGLYNGIVPVVIEVTTLQAAEKLSQDKSADEHGRIIADLHRYDDAAARELAAYMQQKYGK